MNKISRIDQLSNSIFKIGLKDKTTTFTTYDSYITLDKILQYTPEHTPTNDNDVTSKKYVDSAISAHGFAIYSKGEEEVSEGTNISDIVFAGSAETTVDVSVADRKATVTVDLPAPVGGTSTGNDGAHVLKNITVTEKGRVSATESVEITPTLIGAQPVDNNLTTITTTGEGILVKTSAGVVSREVTGDGTISVTNGTGVDGNVQISIKNASTSEKGVVMLVDSLDSADNTAALTAAQGKALNESKLSLTGGTMTGALILNGAPEEDNGAATKAYVDAVAEGLNIHPMVVAATTANITLSGSQEIDGYTVSAGDRVLVKDQDNAVENGIYVVSDDAWTRAEDCDEDTELTSCYVFVGNGSTYSGFGFSQVGTATVGSTETTWTIFSRATKYSVVSNADPITVELVGNEYKVGIKAASDSMPGAVKIADTYTGAESDVAASAKALNDVVNELKTADNGKIDKMDSPTAGVLIMANSDGNVEPTTYTVADTDIDGIDDAEHKVVTASQVATYVAAEIEAATPNTVLVPVEVDITSAGGQSTASIPSNAFIHSVNLVINTPFTASSTISASTGSTELVNSSYNDPATAGIYEGESMVKTTDSGIITVTVNGATEGNGKLFVVYSIDTQK